jgi:hypothetical protein
LDVQAIEIIRKNMALINSIETISVEMILNGWKQKFSLIQKQRALHQKNIKC